MLYYIKNLSIDEIQPYHKTFDRIKSQDEYKKLKIDIEKNGIIDPVLIHDIEGINRIHVGEQRLLIARELKIETLKAFIYNIYKGEAEVEIIKDVESIDKYFKDCSVPTCDNIFRYIKHGQIKL